MTGDGRRQVVVLSSIDWDTAWQRHQIFAAAFAAEGREVFFVENTGFRNPVWRDLPRLWRRLRNIAIPSSVAGSNSVPAGVRVLSPRVLPPTWRLFRRLNSRFLLPRLLGQLRRAGLRPGAACVVYVPTATTLELVRRLEPSAVLYDCASNFRAHPDAPPDFPALERELLSVSGQVVCDSDFLRRQKEGEHPHVEQIHQGVPEEFFRLPPPGDPPRRFCYYGTWSRDLDARLVEAVAAAGFRAAVRGFAKGDAPPLSAAVERAGPVAREELAGSLEPYDGFLLPYRVNPFLLGVVPAKIYECLAAGRPVIAAPLPSLQALGDLVYVGETPEDWARIARELPRTESAELRRRRVELARRHSAAVEFARFKARLEDAGRRRLDRAADFDVAVLSARPWAEAPEARRREAASWASGGRRVYFVELGGGSRGRALPAAAPPPDGIERISALFLPSTRRLWREANASLLAPRMADLLHDRGLRPGCVAVTCGDSPHAQALLEHLSPCLVARGEDGPAGPEALLPSARAAWAVKARQAPPAEGSRLPAFLRGLGWIGALYGLAKASTLLTQIAAGRWLGPEEYGRANLALAAAAYLQIAPMLGFPTAMGKFLSQEDDEARRARFVTTALLAFAVWTGLCLPLMAAAHRWLETALGVPASLFIPSLALATANAVYLVLSSPLLGLKRFAHRGLVEASYGLAVPSALLAGVLLVAPGHRVMLAALISGYAMGAAYALWCLRRYLVPAFEPGVLRAVWRYAAVASLNLLSAACVLAPARLLLHAHRGSEDVGLFSAYFTATIQVALALLHMLQSVIVPMASDPRGQRETWAAAKRWALPGAIAAWAVFLAGLLTALAVFGRHYPLRWDWALAFSGAAALALVHGTLSALYSARDFSGLRVSVLGGLLAGLANAALSAWLVPAYGVSGAAAALAVSFAAGTALFLAARLGARPS